MFESGGWEESSSEEDEDEGAEAEEEEEEEEEEGEVGWGDMEGMRRETERVREEEERRRIEGVGGQAAITTNGVGVGAVEDGAVGVLMNGHSRSGSWAPFLLEIEISKWYSKTD